MAAFSEMQELFYVEIQQDFTGNLTSATLREGNYEVV